MHASHLRRTLALGALLTFTAAAACAAPHPMWLRGHAPTRGRAADTELYYGGPVLSSVKVVSVMWGSNVNPAIVAGIGGFYTAVTNSTWFDITAQYATDLTGVNGHPGTDQTIGRGIFMSQVVITPHNTATTLTDKAVRKEIVAQIRTKKLPRPDANTLYMIYFPSGIAITLGGAHSCSSFGAYHEGFKTKAYGGVFYGVMPECGYSFSGESVVSAHELAEATTDAFPTPGSKPDYPQAWNTSDGYEIADLCEGNAGTVKTASGNYTVQQLFSNLTGACTTGNYTSP